MENTDQLDIEACLNGDEQAYARLLQRHQPYVSRLMWRFSRDPVVCEELVQEVFVQAYYGLAGYRGDGTFGGWLSCIATRVGYKFWKQQAKQNAHYQINEDDLLEAATEEPDDVDPETAGEIVHFLLGKLKEEDRLVLTLMYFEGWSTEEIAKKMDWNRGIVKMRAYRARNKLRTIAEKQGVWEKLGWIS